MKKLSIIYLLIVIFSCNNSHKEENDFETLFEKSKGKETPVYDDIISFYKNLSDSYDELSFFSFGETDSGKPLHLIVYNNEPIFNVSEIKNSKKNRVLINNGIHPGESDGIDASMMFLRDIVKNDSLKQKYKNSIICIIPVYNIGGALNRSSSSRANQNGPKEYGFRGNARNYDLNRDFIKQDTKNALAFSEVFHTINPDVFIDNHVSNGADYQYAITHLFTQHNKLGGDLGNFLNTKMRSDIEESLKNKGIDITPYVNVWGSTPKSGWSQFFDSPRYSTGYTTLFHTLGLMVETHMLKPYKQRVEQTYELMFSSLDFAEENSKRIKELRANKTQEILKRKKYPIQYKVDNENYTNLNFKGYEGRFIDSEVTNGKRLFYDKNKPYEEVVKYYDNFIVTKEIDIPKAYIIPQGWHEVIKRLRINNIEFNQLKNDSIIQVEVNHIKDYKTRTSPYEGHYLHFNTTITSTTEDLLFKSGDYYIPTNQNGIRYILETLEAEATDSFFNWNFFDTILQQKEGYSSYVFEDIAKEILESNSKLRNEFEDKLESDKDFSENPRLQLDFIYKNSDYYEKEHLRLPIFKIH